MRSRRSHRGSAIAELGPSLFMLLVVVFFPMMMVLGLGAQYACGWYHNHLMLQELPVRPIGDNSGGPQTDNGGGTVHKEIYNRFDKTGLASFTGVTSVQDTVDYPVAAAGQPLMVRCTTTVNGKPFISLPWFGFTQTSFTVSGEATREVVERVLSMN